MQQHAGAAEARVHSRIANLQQHAVPSRIRLTCPLRKYNSMHCTCMAPRVGASFLCFQLFLGEQLPSEIVNMHHSSSRFIELTDKCFNGTFSVNFQYLEGSEDSKCRYHLHGTSAKACHQEVNYSLSANRPVASDPLKAWNPGNASAFAAPSAFTIGPSVITCSKFRHMSDKVCVPAEIMVNVDCKDKDIGSGD